MRYVIRKKGTDKYLHDNAQYGPLDEAYVYDRLEWAKDEAYPEDEIVQVELTVGAVVPTPAPAEDEG